jgi:hypothetical protein
MQDLGASSSTGVLFRLESISCKPYVCKALGNSPRVQMCDATAVKVAVRLETVHSNDCSGWAADVIAGRVASDSPSSCTSILFRTAAPPIKRAEQSQQRESNATALQKSKHDVDLLSIDSIPQVVRFQDTITIICLSHHSYVQPRAPQHSSPFILARGICIMPAHPPLSLPTWHSWKTLLQQTGFARTPKSPWTPGLSDQGMKYDRFGHVRAAGQ